MNSLVEGVTPSFLTVRSFATKKGRFINEIDIKRNNKVAVIGSEIVERLYKNQNPIGEKIRINNIAFDIVGVMKSKGIFTRNKSR